MDEEGSLEPPPQDYSVNSSFLLYSKSDEVLSLYLGRPYEKGESLVSILVKRYELPNLEELDKAPEDSRKSIPI